MNRLLKPCLVLALICAAAVGGRGQTSPTVFINEIHYDNTGTDAGEFIEIAGPAGTNLADYSIVLYNGATGSGATYDTDILSGTIPDQQNGFGTVSLSYPSNGIQNGSPDGVALVFQNTTVIQFLSYEGTFTATNGPANGLTSTDIGVTEAGTEPIGLSLQLTGTGTTYADFTWNAPAGQSPGAVNTGQSFTGTAGPTIAIDDVSVTEGNSGTVDATFTVTVSGPHSGVTFDIATADGTGTAPATVGDGDYAARSEIAQLIPSGSTTYSFTVAVNGDLIFEPSEQFSVTLSNVSGATVIDGQGAGTITNDDAAPPVVSTVVISQVYGGGGNTGATFTHDFIELFNRGTSSVSLAGWSVQYTGATSHRHLVGHAPRRLHRSGRVLPGAAGGRHGRHHCASHAGQDGQHRHGRRCGEGGAAQHLDSHHGRVPGPRHVRRSRRLRSNDLRGRGRTNRCNEQHPGRTAQARRVLRFRQQQRRLLGRLTESAQQRVGVEELRLRAGNDSRDPGQPGSPRRFWART